MSSSNRRSRGSSNDGNDGSSSSSSVPFKTGRHTYASWVNPNDQANRSYQASNDDDDYYDNDDSYSNNDSNDNDDSNDSSNDSSMYNSNERNPLISGLRKLYDVVFFYGLDSSIPKNRKKRSSSSSSSSVKNKEISGPSSRAMKSPFFTVGEQIGQEMLGNPSLFDLEPLQDKYYNKNSNQQSNSKSDSSRRSRSSSSSSDSIGIEKGKLLKDIERLDLILDDLSIELQNIEVSISASEKDNDNDDDLEKMRVFRNELLAEIESIQVEYVTLRAQL